MSASSGGGHGNHGAADSARALAPGKLVISGAYSVLFGAPALVTAVDRYVLADAARATARITPEVAAALEERAGLGKAEPTRVPWFDASELREGERKLGLGSSAAIVAATLAALELATSPALSDAELRERVFPLALAGHRKAQPLGSGVDVAACVHGGTLAATRNGDALNLEALALPDCQIEIWLATREASTPKLLTRLYEARARSPDEFERRIGAQTKAARKALDSVRARDATGFVGALCAQRRALGELGRLFDEEIVPSELVPLAEAAESNGFAILPSGAGGGDVVLCVGESALPAPLRARALALGYRQLPLTLGARGVHRA
jgi:phosphomevalonate kinase